MRRSLRVADLLADRDWLTHGQIEACEMVMAGKIDPVIFSQVRAADASDYMGLELWERVLVACSEILDAWGVETIHDAKTGSAAAVYVNVGFPEWVTIIYDIQKRRYWCCSKEEWMERRTRARKTRGNRGAGKVRPGVGDGIGGS